MLAMLPLTGDTIVAISTPPGEGGIGIARLSGSRAIEICERIFKSPKGIKLSTLKTHRIIYGFIIDPLRGERIDEVLVSVMRAPSTYTREDVVEINCHGGYLVLRRVLELTLREGARLALPGEFTMRAFLNGRIDLTQAEAVLDLIRAKTDEAERIAIEQVAGALGKRIQDISLKLQEIVTGLEAYIDFPEEDIILSPVDWIKEIKDVIGELSNLSSSFHQGRIFREGVTTVIAGRPNVGKSSLLNALVGTDRAIVTEVPGTTRDVIEEVINVKGIPLRLLDTAGIREAKDIVEAEGIRRTELVMEMADLILLVLDGSESLSAHDYRLIERLRTLEKRTIVLLNKEDLGLVIDKNEEILKGWPVIEVSVLHNQGIEELKDLIFNTVVGSAGFEARGGVVITRARHKALIDDALRTLREGLEALEGSQPLEIVAFSLRKAILDLNEIIGVEFSTEELLERIFSEFCIGK